MKHYKVTWDNKSSDGCYPLFAVYNSITDVFECLRAMYVNAINVTFDNDDLLYQLGLLYSGDTNEVSGEGLLVTTEDIEHIRVLREAEADGRLIVLPFRADTIVWSAEPFKDGKIRKGDIVQINVDADGFCGFWAQFNSEPVAAEFIKEDIGKTVFLSREEAEAALAKEK